MAAAAATSQQQQQQRDLEGAVQAQRAVLVEREARVRVTQKMLELLPWLSRGNLDLILCAAPSIRAMFESASSDDDYLWASAFPSAPGPLNGYIPDLVACTTNTFALASGAAHASVQRLFHCKARLQRAKAAKKTDHVPGLTEDVKAAQALVDSLHVWQADKVRDGPPGPGEGLGFRV